MAPDLPFAGLRVVEAATQIAGPYAGKLLLDAGAEVVKVEPPGGDPLRRWTASHVALPAEEDGALFRFLNAAKRSAVLDLETRADRAALLDLAAGADLVIESAGAGHFQEWGLGADALRERNASVSLVSISPWGQDGPWAERPATEFTLQAACGATAYRGLTDRGPVAAGGRLLEWATGTYAAVGALAAWLSARRTGRGQHVDVSMFEVAVADLDVSELSRSRRAEYHYFALAAAFTASPRRGQEAWLHGKGVLRYSKDPSQRADAARPVR